MTVSAPRVYDGFRQTRNPVIMPATATATRPRNTNGTVPRRPRDPDTSHFAGRIGARIRALRHARELTTTELVDRIRKDGYDVTLSLVSDWETARRLPKLEMLDCLARVFGITDWNRLLPPVPEEKLPDRTPELPRKKRPRTKR